MQGVSRSIVYHMTRHVFPLCRVCRAKITRRVHNTQFGYSKFIQYIRHSKFIWNEINVINDLPPHFDTRYCKKRQGTATTLFSETPNCVINTIILWHNLCVFVKYFYKRSESQKKYKWTPNKQINIGETRKSVKQMNIGETIERRENTSVFVSLLKSACNCFSVRLYLLKSNPTVSISFV